MRVDALAFMWLPNQLEYMLLFNKLRARQNGQLFPDDISKCIFMNEGVSITIKISLRFIPKGPINNIRALVQIMAWRRPGDRPLSEPMMVNLLTHICVTRPQWVNELLLWLYISITPYINVHSQVQIYIPNWAKWIHNESVCDVRKQQHSLANGRWGQTWCNLVQ